MEELELEKKEEEQEEQKPRKNSIDSKKPIDYKQIVINTVKDIIQDYKELMKNSGDEMLLKGFENELKDELECVNYVMNNLVEKRIYGGRDNLMYPYIHDYYVDDLDKKLLLDNWSSRMNGGSNSNQQVRVQKPTQKDIMEAYDALSNEEKNKIYLDQLKRAEEEAYKKAQAKLKADAEKAKQKEKERKEKEAERKAQEEANKPKQMSLFDM